MQATEYATLLSAHLPARAHHCELALSPRVQPPVFIDERGALIAAVTLVTFDPQPPGQIRDIKEQEVCLADTSATPAPRLRAYLEGHLRALPALLERHGADIDTVLPMDLLGYPEALSDASLVSADDFARALGDRARVDGWHAARVRAEWCEVLAPCGLEERVDEVRALLLPSIRLRLDPVESPAGDAGDADDADDAGDAGDADDAGDDSRTTLGARRDELEPVGISRVGGAPDLPRELPWPVCDGEPLTFVAQLELASLAAFPAAAALPRTGLLSFFYGPIPAPGERHLPVRVLHFDDARTLTRRTPPGAVERVAEQHVEPAAERMLPPVETPFYEALLPEATQRTFRRSVLEAARGGGEGVVDPLAKIGYVVMQWSDVEHEDPVHRVLGYAASIQGDPYVDVEVDAVRGGYDGWRDDSDEAIALRRSARRWRLLLQIDASNAGELLLNQDGGYLYFWISDEALAAHDWSRVRATLQCH